MKINRAKNTLAGALTMDLAVAMALLALALFPLAASFVSEQKQARVYSARAAAIEAMDGEFELICALGRYPSSNGGAPHSPLSLGAAQLPPGELFLERQEKTLRLVWRPKSRDQGGLVKKEVQLP